MTGLKDKIQTVVNIAIYDMTGKEVFNLQKENVFSYKTDIDMSSILGNGIYLIRIKADSDVVNERVVLLRNKY